MRDINLKPPTIHWSDIGGYEDVKLALQDVLRTPDVCSSLKSGLLQLTARIIGSPRESLGADERCSPVRPSRLLQDHDRTSHGNRNRLQLFRG